jgi:hypothetical protein
MGLLLPLSIPLHEVAAAMVTGGGGGVGHGLEVGLFRGQRSAGSMLEGRTLGSFASHALGSPAPAEPGLLAATPPRRAT